MVHPDDVSFAAQLEQAIRKALSGDDKVPGLYQNIRNSPNWDIFNQTKGRIDGFEAVLGEMRRIAKRMNGEPIETNYAERTVN